MATVRQIEVGIRDAATAKPKQLTTAHPAVKVLGSTLVILVDSSIGIPNISDGPDLGEICS